jgi:hypothetical protein
MILNLLIRGPAEDIIQTIAAITGVERVDVTGNEDGCARVRVLLKPGEDAREKISSAVVLKKWGLVELRPERASLEDIFLQATAKEAEVES